MIAVVIVFTPPAAVLFSGCPERKTGWVRDDILKVCEHDILIPLVGISLHYDFGAVGVLGTKMNWIDTEVKRSKVKVTARAKAYFSRGGTDRRFDIEYNLFTLLNNGTYWRIKVDCLCTHNSKLRNRHTAINFNIPNRHSYRPRRYYT